MKFCRVHRVVITDIPRDPTLETYLTVVRNLRRFKTPIDAKLVRGEFGPGSMIFEWEELSEQAAESALPTDVSDKQG